MKNTLFNWSVKPSKDKFLNSIKKGIRVHLSDGLINKSIFRRVLNTLRYNLTIISFLLVLIGTNFYFYETGKDIRDPEVDKMTQELESIHNELGIKSDLLDNKYHETAEIEKELKKIKSSRVYMLAVVKKEADVDIPDRVNDEHLKLMFTQADSNNIPYAVFFRVLQKESRFKWWVTSSAGAHGYMQMMPATYKSVANDIGQPTEMTSESNIICGAFYLRKKYNEMFNKIIHKKVYDKYDFNLNENVNNLSEKEFLLYEKECLKIKSDTAYFNNHNTYVWELALSCYNAGSSRVDYEIPNITETQKYVKFILKPYYKK